MVGGDIIEINYNHPTKGSGVLFAKAGEDSTYNFGGIMSDDDQAGVASNGEVIDKMTRKRWSFETTLAWDMNVDMTLEKLVALQSDPQPATWTISHINGSVYGAKGKPVGDFGGSGGNATIAFKIGGGGQLVKQA